MNAPNLVLLYVEDAVTSECFYRELFDFQPVEKSENFAMFAFDSGLLLGLWSKHEVKPVTQLAGGGSELAIRVESEDALNTIYESWKERGITIAQDIIQMDFGLTFVALDPDHHRLRVYYASY
ncbi:VOC family protein [Pectobacterium peruviense]|uniref:Phenazine antibiotic resistance protein n=1 Tax=Pectobacterium peruviense TaxID=2066479 RepID=A0ABX4S3S5_9GAMM|nr:VOC family protein [Pectobacterium peruviense]KML65165.1 drug:proton antiporter [Pectobacterium peruviense]PKX81781.1 drug:proton antiporter [Pectobacterium peruviense]PKX85195.1 drug:proton antiporter [Pectobacterium peruviense]